MAPLTPSQRKAVSTYQQHLWKKHVFGRIHRLLHRWFGLYVSLSYKSLPGKRKIYREGHPVDIGDVRALARARDAMQYSFEVPVSRCVWGYGWRYTADENPFSLYYDKPQLLEAFYRQYRPATLADALAMQRLDARTEPSVSMTEALTPPIQPVAWGGKCGLDKQHGCNLSGPVSDELLALEHFRLSHVRGSIMRRGWQPDAYDGHVQGFFLLMGDEFVFHVSSGCHRAAALSSMGRQTLPAVFHPRTPRMVDIANQPDEVRLQLYFDDTLRIKRRQFLAQLQAAT